MKKVKIKNCVSKVYSLSPYMCLWCDASGCTLPLILVLISSCVYLSAALQVILVSLQGIRKTKIFLVSSAVAFLSILILSISLIPKYLTIGASIEYSSTTVVSLFIMYYYARKFEILKFELIKMAEICASEFVMFFVILGLQELSPILS